MKNFSHKFFSSFTAAVLFLTLFIFCGCSIFGAAVVESRRASATINVPYSQAADVVRNALYAQDIRVPNIIIKPKSIEVKGVYKNEKILRIDIFRTDDGLSKIDVRVGKTEKGKLDAQNILQMIIDAAESRLAAEENQPNAASQDQ